MLPSKAQCRVSDTRADNQRLHTGKRILPYAGAGMMKMIVDQATFEKLSLLNIDRGEADICAAHAVSAVLKPHLADIVLRYEVIREDSTGYLLHRVYVSFHRNGIWFYVVKQSYPKTTYHIYVERGELRYVDHYSEAEAWRGLAEPNRIGTITATKIGQWVEYLTQYYQRLLHLNRENEEHIKVFQARTESLPDVAWSSNRRSGRIERGGIIYQFRINTTSISEEILLGVGCRSLDDFLLISDNKYLKQ